MKFVDLRIGMKVWDRWWPEKGIFTVRKIPFGRVAPPPKCRAQGGFGGGLGFAVGP